MDTNDIIRYEFDYFYVFWRGLDVLGTGSLSSVFKVNAEDLPDMASYLPIMIARAKEEIIVEVQKVINRSNKSFIVTTDDITLEITNVTKSANI